MSLGSLLLEFLVCLCRTFWFSVVAFFKLFLPIAKKDVSKEIVLVTGAGMGLGRLMALRFAELGAQVVLWDVNSEANEAVAEEIRRKGRTAHPYLCDLRKREDIYKSAAQVKRDVGDVTILVNNAGVVSGKKFMDIPDEKVEMTFQVNTLAHFWTLKAFLPAMMAKNHGHIITIASSAGLFGVSGLVDYCASKFGAVGTHESLLGELVTSNYDGIHATCVCPFYINTGMFDGVKTRLPLIMPILKPEYAVSKIMDAFHSNQDMLMIPRMIYLFYFMKSFLPTRAGFELAKFFGANTTMDTFRGRQKQD